MHLDLKIIRFFISVLLVSTLAGCIGDDFVYDEVEPQLNIITEVRQLPVDTTFQLEYLYLNNVGIEEEVNPIWTSSYQSIISVDETGLLSTHALGKSIITLAYDNGISVLMDTIHVLVGDKTIIINEGKSGVIKSTSSYELEGSFSVTSDDNNLIISIADDYKASTSLPGLYVYLSNNSSVVSNGYEIGKVTVFDGEHQYLIEGISINDYKYLVYFCKPFNVKVGDGEIK